MSICHPPGPPDYLIPLFYHAFRKAPGGLPYNYYASPKRFSAVSLFREEPWEQPPTVLLWPVFAVPVKRDRGGVPGAFPQAADRTVLWPVFAAPVKRDRGGVLGAFPQAAVQMVLQMAVRAVLLAADCMLHRAATGPGPWAAAMRKRRMRMSRIIYYNILRELAHVPEPLLPFFLAPSLPPSFSSQPPAL